MDGEGVTERSVDEWQSTVSELFPVSVRVVPARDGLPDYTARPGRVYTGPNDGKTWWSLGVTETHEELLSLDGAKVNDDGTLTVHAYDSTAQVRPSNDRWV